MLIVSDKKNDYITEAIILPNNVNQTASKNLGVTKEYNKENRDKLWDSAKGKSEYKEKMF